MTEHLDEQEVAAQLCQFEESLDPADPERSGAKVLAYGEISAALTIPDVPLFHGIVLKRMSGFADEPAARSYQQLLAEYLDRLAAAGIKALATSSVLVPVPGRRPSVYLLQAQLPADSLGHRVLHSASDDELAAATTVVLDQTLKAFAANAADPHDQFSIDAQLSNWSFGTTGEPPVLIDVGTPFIRRSGKHAFDQEILLSAVPPGIRSYYRWKGTASEYMDDYFEPRLIAVDLLGNFYKEGTPQRIPVGLRAANAWLAGPAADLQSRLAPPSGDSRPITESEVADYYRQDAATLELFLRVRRADRAIRRLLRRRYDFILPGPVER